jgi:hypothetical protein
MTTGTPRDEYSRVIRASEVGAYSYCAHAWWLRSLKGEQPDDVGSLQAGRVAHERHGRHVMLGTVLTRLSYLLLLLAGVAGLGWVVSLLLGSFVGW